MSFTCSVCLELLSNAADVDSNQLAQRPPSNNSDILATTCGHLYHAVCLRNWFHSQANRHDCPTCRRAINEQQCVKIYLPTSGDEENGAGSSKLAKLKGEIEKLKEDLKTANAYLDIEKAIEIQIRSQLFEERAKFNGAESQYVNQIIYLKERNQTLEEQIYGYEQRLTAKQSEWQERRKENDASTRILEKEVEECRLKFVAKQEELERVRRQAYEESAGIIESLTMSCGVTQREELRSADAVFKERPMNLSDGQKVSQTAVTDDAVVAGSVSSRAREDEIKMKGTTAEAVGRLTNICTLGSYTLTLKFTGFEVRAKFELKHNGVLSLWHPPLGVTKEDRCQLVAKPEGSSAGSRQKFKFEAEECVKWPIRIQTIGPEVLESPLKVCFYREGCDLNGEPLAIANVPLGDIFIAKPTSAAGRKLQGAVGIYLLTQKQYHLKVGYLGYDFTLEEAE